MQAAQEADMITVMGATGHTGRQIAQALLESGQKVRALGRSPSKLAPLAQADAEVMIGDANDAGFLTEAFRGSDAVYTLLAPSPQSPDYRAAQDRMGEAITQAVRDSGARQVVALSSLGADAGEGTGVIAGLHAQEERLARIAGLHLLLLRPAWFFENFEGQLPLIEQQGIVADALAAELVMPMVATRDIAQVAAQALVSRNWQGRAVRELLGPHDITPAQATAILGERLHKPGLRYVALPYEEMAGALVSAGVSASFAALYAQTTRAINEQRTRPRAGRNDGNTTPTRFEDFARELAQENPSALGE
jgi:uncharacterized protein YbjT (DUF2867 family)